MRWRGVALVSAGQNHDGVGDGADDDDDDDDEDDATGVNIKSFTISRSGSVL